MCDLLKMKQKDTVVFKTVRSGLKRGGNILSIVLYSSNVPPRTAVNMFQVVFLYLQQCISAYSLVESVSISFSLVTTNSLAFL